MKRFALVLALLALPAAANADSIDLGPRGVFTVAVPSGWKMSAQKEEDSGYAITLSPPGDVNAKCLVNLAFVPKPEPVTKERVQEEVLSVCDQFVDQSVEKKKVLRDFNVPGSFGYYCVFTDASMVGQPPKKDEFKVIGIGIIRFSDEVMAAVSVAADDEKGQVFALMISTVSGATLAPPR